MLSLGPAHSLAQRLHKMAHVLEVRREAPCISHTFAPIWPPSKGSFPLCVDPTTIPKLVFSTLPGSAKCRTRNTKHMVAA